MFPDLEVERLTGEQVMTMIRSEKQLLASGAPHFHAVITARPKQGSRRTVALARYRAERRFPALFRELRFVRRRYLGSQKVPVGSPEG
jgi:hypothetical protein